jgi:hypothetical protein
MTALLMIAWFLTDEPSPDLIVHWITIAYQKIMH